MTDPADTLERDALDLRVLVRWFLDEPLSMSSVETLCKRLDDLGDRMEQQAVSLRRSSALELIKGGAA